MKLHPNKTLKAMFGRRKKLCSEEEQPFLEENLFFFHSVQTPNTQNIHNCKAFEI
jgi:hypothetical protein